MKPPLGRCIKEMDVCRRQSHWNQGVNRNNADSSNDHRLSAIDVAVNQRPRPEPLDETRRKRENADVLRRIPK